MANPSISVPDELLDEFDETIWYLETQGELPSRTSRSEVLQELMEEFVEQHREGRTEGNPNAAVAIAN